MVRRWVIELSRAVTHLPALATKWVRSAHAEIMAVLLFIVLKREGSSMTTAKYTKYTKRHNWSQEQGLDKIMRARQALVFHCCLRRKNPCPPAAEVTTMLWPLITNEGFVTTLQPLGRPRLVVNSSLKPGLSGQLSTSRPPVYWMLMLMGGGVRLSNMLTALAVTEVVAMSGLPSPSKSATAKV